MLEEDIISATQYMDVLYDNREEKEIKEWTKIINKEIRNSVKLDKDYFKLIGTPSSVCSRLIKKGYVLLVENYSVKADKSSLKYIVCIDSIVAKRLLREKANVLDVYSGNKEYTCLIEVKRIALKEIEEAYKLFD